jgi:hypothetical protein
MQRRIPIAQCAQPSKSLENVKCTTKCIVYRPYDSVFCGYLQDVQYADIDYMDEFKDFTLDMTNFGGLTEYVQELKEQGTNFMIILVR